MTSLLIMHYELSIMKYELCIRRIYVAPVGLVCGWDLGTVSCEHCLLYGIPLGFEESPSFSKLGEIWRQDAPSPYPLTSASRRLTAGLDSGDQWHGVEAPLLPQPSFSKLGEIWRQDAPIPYPLASARWRLTVGIHSGDQWHGVEASRFHNQALLSLVKSNPFGI